MIYMQRIEALQAEIQRLENQQVDMQQRPVARRTAARSVDLESLKPTCAQVAGFSGRARQITGSSEGPCPVGASAGDALCDATRDSVLQRTPPPAHDSPVLRRDPCSRGLRWRQTGCAASSRPVWDFVLCILEKSELPMPGAGAQGADHRRRNDLQGGGRGDSGLRRPRGPRGLLVELRRRRSASSRGRSRTCRRLLRAGAVVLSVTSQHGLMQGQASVPGGTGGESGVRHRAL